MFHTHTNTHTYAYTHTYTKQTHTHTHTAGGRHTGMTGNDEFKEKDLVMISSQSIARDSLES